MSSIQLNKYKFTLKNFPNKTQLNVLREEYQNNLILQMIYNRILNDTSSDKKI
jgi:hypothetical protein